MHADEFDHIRADVHSAILEAQQHDPTVTLEILWRLFDAVGACATDPFGDAAVGDVYPALRVVSWGERVLRDVQLRAVSKVPYGEPQPDEPPEDHRD